MIKLKHLINDQLIPVILLFSIILALVITSKISLFEKNSQVLGASLPDVTECRINQCGFCTNCGGPLLGGDERNKGISCGNVSRCVKNIDSFSCRFDINCL